MAVAGGAGLVIGYLLEDHLQALVKGGAPGTPVVLQRLNLKLKPYSTVVLITTAAATYPTVPHFFYRVDKAASGLAHVLISIAPDLNCQSKGLFKIQIGTALVVVDIQLLTTLTKELRLLEGMVYDIPVLDLGADDVISISLRNTDGSTTVSCNLSVDTVEVWPIE